MLKAPRTALIAEGPVSQSWVAKLPGLRRHLGPVKGVTLRSASRAVNLIRAGVASDNYADLQRCEVVLLGVPDSELAKWIEALLASNTNWARVAFITCSNRNDSSMLNDLRQNGAHTGSLSEMEGFAGKKYIFEGDNVALHRLRRLIESDGTARIVEIGERKRPVYEAGLTFAVGMTFPMIAAAVDSMRAAGIHAKIAENAVENAVLGAVRAYLRAGRRGWTGAVARSDREELRRQYQALFEVDEELAEMYLKIAVDYLAETAAKGRLGKLSK
jgi:predicted short-subunit dehydrogenase-like oxidoreductase (DUF2520 family)